MRITAALTALLITLSANAQEKPLQYPKPHTVDQTDDYFGTKVPDPYRWMENVDSPEIKSWVDEENALTASYLATVPQRDKIHARLMQLANFERFSIPTAHGERYFYSRNSGLQNQAVIYWTQKLNGEAHTLLDPNTFSADGTVALSGLSVTEDGKLAAYGLADGGSDWVTWHVRDVDTGKDLPDVVRWTKFTGASWLKDNSGFFYAAFDAPAAGTLKSSNFNHKLYFHKLGTPQAEDKLVFKRDDDKEITVGGGVTDDGRYLVIDQVKGDKNQVSVVDLKDPAAKPVLVIAEMDATNSFIDNVGTTLYFQTTKDAPNGQVIAIDLAKPAERKVVIAESREKLDSIGIVNHLFLANYLGDAHSKVEVFDLAGKHLRSIELPGVGTAGGFGGEAKDTDTFYLFTNYTNPGTIYHLDLKSFASTVYKQPKLNFDPAKFETKQVFYASKDGTKVPMFITSRKGLKLDGMNQTILYGYGGFNIPLTPSYASSIVNWVEMGGVYAVANLRGGSEYGEAWHEAGTKLHKQNVFDDFIAAAEYLIHEKYTSTPRLAIQGGSNGGLLVGACITQRPELFGAALPQVGVMDMLRFDKFTIGYAWKSDYGSPSDDEAEFKAIYKYSPLHNIHPGTAYPPTLITTADHDDRVFPAHSFKFAATMQAAQKGANPILIRIETRAGHGAGMPLSKQMDLTADMYAFLVKTLKFTPLAP